MKLDNLIKTTLNLNESFVLKDEHGPGLIEGWDSLGHINLMEKLESGYGVSLDISEVIAIESVADIKAILRSKNIKEF